MVVVEGGGAGVEVEFGNVAGGRTGGGGGFEVELGCVAGGGTGGGEEDGEGEVDISS